MRARLHTLNTGISNITDQNLGRFAVSNFVFCLRLGASPRSFGTHASGHGQPRRGAPSAQDFGPVAHQIRRRSQSRFGRAAQARNAVGSRMTSRCQTSTGMSKRHGVLSQIVNVKNKSRVGKGRPAGSIELRVSPSPSKIPYGGFSPVRLQMDRQWRPSARPRGLSAVHMRPTTPAYTPPQLHLPGIRGPVGITRSRTSRFNVARLPASDNTSIQRPLARHRVMLSRRVIAYYGLIRPSESLPATYGFAAGSAAPKEIGLRWESRGSPIYSVGLCSRAASLTPVARRVQATVTSPSVLAFTPLLRVRRPH